MSKVPIGPLGLDDPFYRYKRPECVLERHKSEIYWTNAEEISKELARPINQIVKFIKFPSCMNKTKVRFYQDIKVHDLEKELESYTEKYVCCPGCQSPETTIEPAKNAIKFYCKACGKVAKKPAQGDYDLWLVEKGLKKSG